jgi:hypothetical protein
MSDCGFRAELECLINKHCMENNSNTPDFVLTEYIMCCLAAYDTATKERDRWYGVHLEPANSHFIKHEVTNE